MTVSSTHLVSHFHCSRGPSYPLSFLESLISGGDLGHYGEIHHRTLPDPYDLSVHSIISSLAYLILIISLATAIIFLGER